MAILLTLTFLLVAFTFVVLCERYRAKRVQRLKGQIIQLYHWDAQWEDEDKRKEAWQRETAGLDYLTEEDKLWIITFGREDK